MDLAKAMMEAGVYCNRLAGPRGYAGTPFYSGGTCVYITDGARSVCDRNRVPHHQPLCYCRGKLELYENLSWIFKISIVYHSHTFINSPTMIDPSNAGQATARPTRETTTTEKPSN